MHTVPLPALVLATAVLLVVWLFLAHMISSRKEDARLQFLLDLTDPPQVDRGRHDPANPRPAFLAPERNAVDPLPAKADEYMTGGNSGVVRLVSQELPVVFAAALRGRAM